MRESMPAFFIDAHESEVSIMAWYDEAIFYHIYPLGLVGAPKQNAYEEPVSRLNTLLPWIDHIRKIGCTALYIGPLFESVGHGYETTDYKKLDSRLGTNEDLKHFVAVCHEKGLKVIFDGVFNHTGRDFFAFKDIREKREASPYRDWYCNVNFYGNNEYNDGFSYDNWGGYNLLAKLNQWNGAVRDYIADVIRFWVSEFDVDGIRLDAADVLDFDYMKALRRVANEIKPEFYLMGEVIHGDYTRWVGGDMLNAVTNYTLHKALYSGHNDHNYFEIAHTVKRLNDMGACRPNGLRLYNFVDNHDVERIYTKLNNKAHFIPAHILLYTLPGVPSIYYGSEFGIEGRKWRGGTDDEIRPALDLKDYQNALQDNVFTKVIAALGKVRSASRALSYGSYTELMLTTRQYAFARSLDGEQVIVVVNNDDAPFSVDLPAMGKESYHASLSSQTVYTEYDRIRLTIPANSGEILLSSVPHPESVSTEDIAKVAMPAAAPEKEEQPTPAPSVGIDTASEDVLQADAEKAKESAPDYEALLASAASLSYDEMSVEQLQAAILSRMAQNGPVTDSMKRDVYQNIWHDSLVNWIKSFR